MCTPGLMAKALRSKHEVAGSIPVGQMQEHSYTVHWGHVKESQMVKIVVQLFGSP